MPFVAPLSPWTPTEEYTFQIELLMKGQPKTPLVAPLPWTPYPALPLLQAQTPTESTPSAPPTTAYAGPDPLLVACPKMTCAVGEELVTVSVVGEEEDRV